MNTKYIATSLEIIGSGFAVLTSVLSIIILDLIHVRNEGERIKILSKLELAFRKICVLSINIIYRTVQIISMIKIFSHYFQNSKKLGGLIFNLLTVLVLFIFSKFRDLVFNWLLK